VFSVDFDKDGSKIVSGGQDGTIKVWDADSFDLIESRPGDGTAFGKDGEGVERDGATVRMKEGGGAFYAPSPVQCVAIHGSRIAAGASSGELYHLEVM
jgi:WD40 repeat protein